MTVIKGVHEILCTSMDFDYDEGYGLPASCTFHGEDFEELGSAELINFDLVKLSNAEYNIGFEDALDIFFKEPVDCNIEVVLGSSEYGRARCG